MINIYHNTKTSLGYVYVAWDDKGEQRWVNDVRKFESEFEKKNYLTQVKIDYIRYAVQNFVLCYKHSNEAVSQLEISSVEIIHKIDTWANSQDRTIAELKEKITKYKPHFTTLVKSA